jgi:hypothetical protein
VVSSGLKPETPRMCEGPEFARRSWRQQRVLTLVWLAIDLGLAVVGLVRFRSPDHYAWLAGVWVVLWIGMFMCLVLLVRRDEPTS